jgi:SseB protein N-terminal domain
VAGLNPGGQRVAGDDGRADPRLAALLAAYAAGQEPESAVLAALSGARLLVPLVERAADPAEHGAPEHGALERADPAHAHPEHGHPEHGACSAAKEMAVPTLIGRDGRPALPAFTSLDALVRWRPGARPLPAPAAQVWGTAAGSRCAVVIDVAGPVPLAVDGARLDALARGEPAPAPQDDPDVQAQVADVLAAQPAIVGVRLSGGTAGTDLAVRLEFRPGDTAPPVQSVAEAIAARLAGRLRRGIEVSAVPARAAGTHG